SDKWKRPLILSQLAAKNFWNQKNSNASYARLSPAKPVCQETVKQTRKVSFPFLSTLNILLCEGDGISGLALWLPARSFSFSASLIHLKRYVFSLERFDMYFFKYQETMANQRMFKEKQALVLALLCEGTPINAIVRMLHVGKH